MPQSDRSPPAVAPTGPIGYRARPALTICIPAYRATPFLDRTLNALRRQTFRDFQVILSNDGGHDAPEIDRLCADPGIRVIHQTARLGWVRNKTGWSRWPVRPISPSCRMMTSPPPRRRRAVTVGSVNAEKVQNIYF